MKTIDAEYIKTVLKPRSRDAHKGDFGKVLIYAGSTGMAGAAVLCGRAALKSGAGLVRFLLPSFDSPIYPVLQTAVPEATCVAFDKDPDIGEYSSIICGPGLGDRDESSYIFQYILSHYPGAAVLDADALNMLSNHPELTEYFKESEGTFILTPHIGEARRLLKNPAAKAVCYDKEDLISMAEGPIKTVEEREMALKMLSDCYNSLVVLKGAGTLCGTDVDMCMNTTGNPGMATGGSGDVLSGIIGGLAAQGLCPKDAANAGVYIHGLAGDLAAEALTEISLTAGDIVNCIPAAFKTVLS